MDRIQQIDIIKGIAIIGVIILHTISRDILFNIGAPFHIWQAVPIFLMIAGINGANSYIRSEKNTLSDLYNINLMIKRLKRLIIPFVIIWIIQLSINLYNNKQISILNIIESLLLGGAGPGSYFVPLMIQCVLILPLIYYIGIKSTADKLLIYMFIVSMLFELVCYIIKIDPYIYRYLFPRYLFAVSLGVWFVLSVKKNYLLLICGTIASFAYILGVNYYDFSILNEPLWTSQHAPSYFWTLFLIIIGIKFLPSYTNFIWNVISIVGKASYHIFLIQMLYFWLKCYRYFLEFPLSIYLLTNISICILVGIVFYLTEDRIRKTLIMKNK